MSSRVSQMRKSMRGSLLGNEQTRMYKHNKEPIIIGDQ
jgi:hypothetical protein